MSTNFSEQYINQLMSSTRGKDQPPNLLDAVRYLGDKEIALALLASTLSNHDQLPGLAAQSYFHYNGFDRIVLLSSTVPNYKIRLHVWWPGTENLPNENVHNHRWDFATFLLMGSYSFEEYSKSEGGNSFHEYIFHPPEGRDRYSMDLIGQTSLKCTVAGRLATGSCYWQSHSVLHRVISNRKHLTATLVMQGPDNYKYAHNRMFICSCNQCGFDPIQAVY